MKYFILLFVATLTLFQLSSCQLSESYYNLSCPNLEPIIQSEFRKLFFLNPTAPAALLRLLFHDCMVRGCDASVLLDFDNSEIKSAKNYAIRMQDTIGEIKLLVEDDCPGVVSCADLIVLAARESVIQTGGPRIQVPLGRKDSTNITTSLDADAKIPPPSQKVDDFISDFTSKGMSIEEAVAILGGHTLGVGHCKNIVGRLNDPAQWNPTDFVYETILRIRCPLDNDFYNSVPAVPLDLTPVCFDNQYYTDILGGRGVFGIDSMVAKDPRTLPFVTNFSQDQNHFFEVFSSAFIKLATADVLTDGQGEVRAICSKFNN
ncbi:peroxidase 29-like [Lotus japonicus]|uniref:peroxidase 29-like n=1 Tax=Lotus japonicus TaxID=34305 RepID=UPI00258E15FF|nr:peroxidase 29-like [Lotus japonicus]